MFDGEHGIALHVIQGNRASSPCEGVVSGFSLSCGRILAYILELWRDGYSKLMFVLRRQDSCLVTMDTSGISLRLDRAIRTLLDVKWETQNPFLLATVILAFLSIFNKSQASSIFETLNCADLSKCPSYVRPLVHMRQAARAFSRISTGDSDIPSPGEMKEEPAFKPMPRYPGFFRFRASRCPFHLRQQTQCPDNMPFAGESLLLICLWKVGIPLQSKPWSQLSSRDDLLLHICFL